MITEDYVSYETAKLLKEKGFDWKCKTVKFYPKPDYDQESPDGVSAPTIQMAMKWLRKVHNFYVDPCPCVEGDYWNNKWNVYVSRLMNRYPFLQFIGVCNTYEEACEAAIKYCLKNLI